MRRLFVPAERIAPDRVQLGEDELHYLRRVLRLGPGADIEVFDGRGGVYAARMSETGELLVAGPRREVPGPGARIELAFALARGERCDVVVQKATELGVVRLSPFQAERSVVRLDARRGEERARRWQRIAEEAARQSERADVPVVDAPTTLQAILAGAEDARIVLLYERGGEPLAEVVDRRAARHLLVVGPEGGFVRSEIEACIESGARLATLGPRILRFETAAIVAVALAQHHAGDPIVAGQPSFN